MTLKAKGLSSYYYFSYSSSSSSACRAMVSLIPFLQLSLILVAAFQFRNSNNSMESLLTAYFHLPARFSTGFFLRIIRPLNCLSYTNICTNKYCKSYVYRTVHHLDRWIKRDQLDVTFLFHYFMLNMFRMLIRPSSGACDLFVELMGCIALVRCVLVLRCGLAGVVWFPDAGFSLHPHTMKWKVI